eukprot:557780-Amphidinium_carterae.1
MSRLASVARQDLHYLAPSTSSEKQSKDAVEKKAVNREKHLPPTRFPEAFRCWKRSDQPLKKKRGCWSG